VLIREGSERRLGSKTTIELEPGDVVSCRTCGGGGYGPPEDRDPDRVLRDVREGKISPERAREIYRVALAADGCGVDASATAALRAAPGP
jgi:N-methylhydantoinase B